MRLLACHIENFGTISNRDYTFDPKLNTFCENNGSGKSTLAVFIKAMFFGLSKTTKNDLDENERLKYKPWQGGSYGGYLDFEYEGRVYRIERYLGEKESEDRLKIYDQAQGTESTNFDKDNLGRVLFGVDEATYEKSIYYSQRQTANSGLSLLSLLEKEGDIGGYEQAIGILDNLKKPYNKRSNTSVLAVIEAKISDTIQNIDECRDYEHRLTQKINSKQDTVHTLVDTEKQLQAVKADIDKAIRQAAHQKYLEYKDNYQQALHNKQLAEDAFGGNIPTEKVLETANSKLNILENLIIKQQETDEKLYLAQLQAAQIEGGTGDMARLAELARYFKAQPPTDDELKFATDSYQKCRQLESQLKPINTKRKYAAFNGATKAIAAVGLLALVVGIIVLIAGQTIAGICTAAVGLLGAAAGFARAVLTAAKQHKLTLQQHNDEQKLLNKDYEYALQAVQSFTARFGIDTDALPHAFIEIGQRISEYLRLKEYTAKQERDTKEQLLSLTNSKTAIANEIALQKQALIGFFISYKIMGAMTELADFKNAYKTLQGEYMEYNAIIAVYNESKKNLELCPQPADNDILDNHTQYDLDTLKAQEKELAGSQLQLAESRAALDSEINSLTEKAASKQEYEAQYDSLLRQKSDSENKLKIIEKTLTHIKAAQSALAEKYLASMNTAFSKYANIVLGESGEITFDNKLEYKIVEYGEKRTAKSFSSGLRDLFDVCAQLALADIIYKDKKPFLVLDDPFKNLDDDKMQSAKKLLHTLTKEYQVIYLICHSSRKL